MSHILIVEDEVKLAQLLNDYLTQSGYECSHIEEGTVAVDWIKQNKPDLILLDLMLPGKDGFEICKEVRQFSQVPVIMMTARVEEIDRLLGLELGADDYICKPYSPREVVARVKAVLRRFQPQTQTTDTGNEKLVLDEKKLSACLMGQELALTAVEFKLLFRMVQEPGRIFSRQQLMDAIYQDHRVVSDRTIDSHIKKLRKKINEHSQDEDLIHSVYGVGYKYEP